MHAIVSVWLWLWLCAGTVVHRDDVHFVRLPDALNEQDDDEAGDRFQVHTQREARVHMRHMVGVLACVCVVCMTQLAVSFERPEVFMCYMTFSPGDQKGFESSEDKWLVGQPI